VNIQYNVSNLLFSGLFATLLRKHRKLEERVREGVQDSYRSDLNLHLLYEHYGSICRCACWCMCTHCLATTI